MNNIDNIKTIVLSVLDELGIELVEIDLLGSKRKLILRVYVHEKGGITLDRCVKASRKIADLLDRNDIFTSKYVLEVSSPGLDRPLKTVRDFERNIGEKIKAIVLVDGKEKKIIGNIKEIKDNKLYLITKEKNIIELELVNLQSAKIIVEF